MLKVVFNDNYSVIRATWEVLENAKCMWSSKVFAALVIFKTIQLLSVSLKRKTNNIFRIVRRMTTAESTRADGLLQQYV